FDVDARPPGAPSLALAAGADTGSSATDGVTRDAMPAIAGTAQAGSTVSVSVDGQLVGSVTAGADGAWRYRLSAPLADGRHSVTAVASNANGPGAPSAALTLGAVGGLDPDRRITARDTPVHGASTLRYELQFSEAVILAADALDVVASGGAQGRIDSIVQTGEGRYLVQLAVSGEGTAGSERRGD
ncbi:Ig-like domain-containing protein, partial [Janthinobacterium sp. GW458P]|uniref:Ig-like domain-containing protein n=1 Tax=Janthinobacterium sp. GW458P TaxID=1981504 RepID=UPI001C0AFFAE